jgi:hypothetical protein
MNPHPGKRAMCTVCRRVVRSYRIWQWWNDTLAGGGICIDCHEKEKKARDLVVGETYSLDELSDMFGVDIDEDTRIIVIG